MLAFESDLDVLRLGEVGHRLCLELAAVRGALTAKEDEVCANVGVFGQLEERVSEASSGVEILNRSRELWDALGCNLALLAE